MSILGSRAHIKGSHFNIWWHPSTTSSGHPNVQRHPGWKSLTWRIWFSPICVWKSSRPSPRPRLENPFVFTWLINMFIICYTLDKNCCKLFITLILSHFIYIVLSKVNKILLDFSLKISKKITSLVFTWMTSLFRHWVLDYDLPPLSKKLLLT